MSNKKVIVIGGGTHNDVRHHLSLSARAKGGTARRLAEICSKHDKTMDVELLLTSMADINSHIETSAQLADAVDRVVADPDTKIVFFNAAVADFNGHVGDIEPSQFSPRLKTSQGEQTMILVPADKIIQRVRKTRKDIFLVGFKATYGETAREQYLQGLNMLKSCSANLVLANDMSTGLNLIIAPEESVYCETTDRNLALKTLVEMAYMRSHLTFTRSTIVDGVPVPWNSDLVPSSLRTVVDYCIQNAAYKKFRGVTAGHFAVKLDDTTFLTSRRKTDFNDMANVGLVKVTTDGPDSVIAYGSRPSVGGQSQRIVFSDHPDEDCVVHFHCIKKEGSKVPTVSQKEFECGSHECGRNTSNGLKDFGHLKAVYLDNHGPNIVFNRNVDPQTVIRFIEENFDLDTKSGGYQL